MCDEDDLSKLTACAMQWNQSLDDNHSVSAKKFGRYLWNKVVRKALSMCILLQDVKKRTSLDLGKCPEFAVHLSFSDFYSLWPQTISWGRIVKPSPNEAGLDNGSVSEFRTGHIWSLIPLENLKLHGRSRKVLARSDDGNLARSWFVLHVSKRFTSFPFSK